MAVTVGNNALLLTPSAGGECVHTEGGRSALIQDVVKKKKEKKKVLCQCVYLLGNHRGIVGHSAAP